LVPDNEIIRYLHEWNKAYEDAATEDGLIEKLTYSGFSPSPSVRNAIVQFCVDTLGWDQPAAEAAYYEAVTRRASMLREQSDKQHADMLRDTARGLSGRLEQIADATEHSPRALIHAYDEITADMRAMRLLRKERDITKPISWTSTIEAGRGRSEGIITSFRFSGGSPDDGEYSVRFPAGALSLVAAPTSHGKTMMAINLILDAVERYPNRRHWLFSFEEDRRLVLFKFLARFIGVPISNNPYKTIRSYYTTGSTEYFAHSVRVEENGRMVDRLPFDILKETEPRFAELIDSGRLNIIDAGKWDDVDVLTALSDIAHHDPGLIMIDYLGLLNARDRQGFSRNEELKQIALNIKDVAIEHDLSVVGAIQFNRAVVSPDHMHTSNIQDSSDLERAANYIVGMWNTTKPIFLPAKQHRGMLTKPFYGDKETRSDRKSMVLHVLKNRDGISGLTGEFPLMHDGKVWGIESRGIKTGSWERAETKEAGVNIKKSIEESINGTI